MDFLGEVIIGQVARNYVLSVVKIAGANEEHNLHVVNDDVVHQNLFNLVIGVIFVLNLVVVIKSRIKVILLHIGVAYLLVTGHIFETVDIVRYTMVFFKVANNVDVIVFDYLKLSVIKHLITIQQDAATDLVKERVQNVVRVEMEIVI